MYAIFPKMLLFKVIVSIIGIVIVVVSYMTVNATRLFYIKYPREWGESADDFSKAQRSWGTSVSNSASVFKIKSNICWTL